jgi:actin related protein 2/3 complex subunit 1A/1B
MTAFRAIIDGRTDRPEPNVWGDRLPFGTICGEFSSPNGGWVHDVAFSPTGDVLAYVSTCRSFGLPAEHC